MSATTKQETFADIINGEIPVLVDFFAEWCGPCKVMKPVLEQLHQKTTDKLRIIKVDIDKSPAAANAFQVQAVPTLLLFKNGQVVWRQAGAVPLPQLEKIITTHL
jgi:thioredoxin 1